MPTSPTPERAKLRAVKDGYGHTMFYVHQSGWVIRRRGSRWTAGRNRFEPQARWVLFDKLRRAHEWCDAHSELPEPGSVKPPVLIARKTAPGRVEVVREVAHV